MGGAADQLNRDCRCVTIDRARLRSELALQLHDEPLYAWIERERPNLFSATGVFLARPQIDALFELIAAIERAVRTPHWAEAALADASPLARRPTPLQGVFMGYDFHMTDTGPRLIEINSNAGGALLAGALASAQHACCPEMKGMTNGPVPLAQLEPAFLESFRHEWRLARGAAALATVAMVDDDIPGQFLYPEFRLFEALFARAGLHPMLVEARDLVFETGRLRAGDRVIDLVYNRLTDFTLEEPAHAALRAAVEADAVVLTPHPRAHALYADKRNLVRLSEPGFVATLGLSDAERAVLAAGVPRTRLVVPGQAETLWAGRKQLFFKPFAGYGSKAVYRGDKITRRVWDEVLQGGYVAQDLALPGERMLRVDDEPRTLKFDVRCFVYDGKPLSLVARLYQGQATNFRTEGGGFAPVFYPPDAGA